MLHVHRIERLDAFTGLQADWNACIDPKMPHGIFLRHEFVHAWFEAFGSGSRPCVLVATSGGRPEGFLPLRSLRDGTSLRRLVSMANGHSPRADLVAVPGREAAVAGAFAAHLRRTDLDWDASVLPELRSGSALLAVLQEFPETRRLLQVQRHAPYIHIEGDWRGFHAQLSKNFQRTLRNNRNRIERAGGARVECLQAPAELEAGLAEMFAIGERSWQGASRSAVGSTPENRRFYTELVRRFGPQGAVRLWFLAVGGRRVAFELHLVHAGTAFGLKTGYDCDAEELGAGTYLDQSIVQHYFEAGNVREYDLLGDAAAYKLRWTSRVREYARLSLYGRSSRGRLLAAWNLVLKPALRPLRDWRRLPARAALVLPLVDAFPSPLLESWPW
jgi:CelD/BcsL family acetyltransferase involved in cellulose biosynthesis